MARRPKTDPDHTRATSASGMADAGGDADMANERATSRATRRRPTHPKAADAGAQSIPSDQPQNLTAQSQPSDDTRQPQNSTKDSQPDGIVDSGGVVVAHDRPKGQKVWPEIVPDLKARFLEEYAANGGVVSHAAKAIGVSLHTPRNWMKQDPAFFAAFEEAKQEANDTIRREVVRRAVEGWDEAVYQNGRFVGMVHKYDSNLLMFYAKSRMPEFRDRVDITSDGQHLNAHQTIVEAANDPETSELAARLLERLATAGDDSGGTGLGGE